MLSRLSLPLVVLCVFLAASAAPAAQPSAPATGELLAEVRFGQDPTERGLKFDRRGLSPRTVEVGGKKETVWVVKQGSAPGAPWGRSVLLTFTDDRFRNGRMPAVDIEVEYLLEANAGVNIVADTAGGSERVGSGWGRQKKWQTLRARIDNAHFGARDHGRPDAEMPSDGHDLRINAAGGDLLIRSIRVRGYDLDTDPDYQRLLKLSAVTTGAADDIFLFRPGDKPILQHQVRNIARKPIDARYAFTATDHGGRTLSSKAGQIRLDGSSVTTIPIEFDSTGLPYGMYAVRFELGAGEANLLEKTTYLGLDDDQTPRKAKPGEFLYGTTNPRRGDLRHRKWLDAMGIDIVRYGIDTGNPEEHRQELRELAERGIRPMLMFEPPEDADPKKFDEQLRKRIDLAVRFAREFDVPFWELGNEPDLTFFYDGPIERYTRGFEAMYDAIKAATPQTIIMNGGLCFFGPDGDRRARTFIDLVDPQKIDAFGYHGHGRGVAAEREALERIRLLAERDGKGDKLFIETESGSTAASPELEPEQAATCVQKIVYVQSQGAPTFIWFLLYTDNRPWWAGMLHNGREPRPVVLAYRNMVQALRGYEFARMVDLNRPDAEGYLFRERQGSGRVLVMWSNKPADHAVDLTLAAGPQQVSALEQWDLYGNASGVSRRADGAAQVNVTEMPTYLRWQAGADADDDAIAAAPAVIDLHRPVQLVQDAQNPLVVRIINPTSKPISAELEVKAAGEVPVTIEPRRTAVALAPAESKAVTLTATVGRQENQLAWPQVWDVYVNADPAFDPARVTAAPSAVGSARATRVFAEAGSVDLARVAGQVKEKAVGWAIAEVVSPIDQTVKIGASADFWMAWYVNGQAVYDTLARGNGGSDFKLTDHVFEVPLKKGPNLLAVKVLSGSMGWRLLSGGPHELRQAAQRHGETERIVLSLSSNGKQIAQDTAAIAYTAPVPMVSAEGLAQITQTPPLFVLGELAVTNLFFKHPDGSRWWQGRNDLSAMGWLGCDGEALHVVISVRDDKHVPPASAEQMSGGDAVQLALAKAGGEVAATAWVADLGGGRVEVRADAASAAGQIRATIERGKDGTTLYRLAVPRPLVGDGVFAIDLLVNDADAPGDRKQFATWRPGLGATPDAPAAKPDPGPWHRTTLGAAR